MRQMVTGYFEEHNVPAGAVSSRSELSRHFAGATPSLIILDLRLGQDDGLDLLRDASHSDVPIIITTGHRRDEIDRVVGLELGADNYIAKPLSLQGIARARPRGLAATRDGTRRPTPMIPNGADTDLTAGGWNAAAEASSIPRKSSS